MRMGLQRTLRVIRCYPVKTLCSIWYSGWRYGCPRAFARCNHSATKQYSDSTMIEYKLSHNFTTPGTGRSKE